MESLTEGVHYYINEDGYVVLTEKYHLERGYCCGNACKHCPFDHISVPESGNNEEQSPVKKDSAS